MANNNVVNTSLSGQSGTGQFVGSTSPTLTTPIIGQINDGNGNAIFGLNTNPSAVNYWSLNNTGTGNPPQLGVIGSDANISTYFVTKGTGLHAFYSANATTPIQWNTGTTYQHSTNWNVPNTAATRTVTLQDADGTIAYLSNIPASLVNSVQGTSNQILVNATSGSPQTGAITLTAPQDIGTSSSPQFNNLTLTGTQIKDTDGNVLVGLTSVSSAVNYINITNDAAGGPPTGAPTISVLGSDTDISMVLRTKGDGGLAVITTSTNPGGAFNIYSGTASQHQTNFDFANTANTRRITFPDVNATLVVDTSSSGGITTTPAASQSSSLILGTAYQNAFGYDVVVTVYLAVTAATVGGFSLGVGPTNTPTQQVIISALNLAAGIVIIPVTIYLPNTYYALLSTTGTITATISGQQAMPV